MRKRRPPKPKPSPIPEPGTPAFEREAHRQSVAIAASRHDREDQEFIDAVTDWE